MRWLFIACSSAIAIAYYLGIKEQEKDMEKLGDAFTSFVYTLAGRTPEFAHTEWSDYPSGSVSVTEVDEDEETPYYLPPGQPKEEKDMVYS